MVTLSACTASGDTIYTDDDVVVVPHMCDAMELCHTGARYEGPVLGLYSSTYLLEFPV